LVPSTCTAAGEHLNIAYAHIFTDGRAGTGTVTISATDASGATVTIGTAKTVTSYGSVASIAIAQTNFTIGKAGGGVTGSNAALYDASAPTGTPAFQIVAKDSAGNLVGSATDPLTFTVTSSNTVSVAGGACIADNGAGLGSSGYKVGVGYFNCNFSTTVAAKSGDSATLTFKTPDYVTDPSGLTYITTTAKVTVGGSVAKTVLSTDSSTYNPGQAMVVTLTATDSAGNPVYDGALNNGATATSSMGLGGTSLANGFTGWFVGGVDATAASVAKSTTYAPATEGTVILNATGTDAAATALSTSFTVANGAASAANDQASLATDAANAATDAANAAADSADAATQAATDALNAVQALDAKVSSLFASLNKKIASIMALVAGMMKK